MFDGMKPEDVKTALENSRKWENRAKSNAPKAQQLDELVKMLSGDKGETDPAKLAQDLTTARQSATNIRIENEVLRTAGKHGADPNRLADSKSFMSKVERLDPEGSDFSSKVAAAIKKQVEDDDSFKIRTGPKPDPTQGHNNSHGRTASDREAGLAEARKRFGQKK
jgi:hypothetical protein